jgi:hypothetical protein
MVARTQGILNLRDCDYTSRWWVGVSIALAEASRLLDVEELKLMSNLEDPGAATKVIKPWTSAPTDVVALASQYYKMAKEQG